MKYPEQYYEKYQEARLTKWDIPVQLGRIMSETVKSDKIIDIGCGHGYYLNFLKQTYGIESQLFGLDASDVSSFVTGHFVFKQGDACNIPYESDTFSIIICNHVLEHIIDPLAAVNEFNRILRPGGCVYIAVPSFRSILLPDSIMNFYGDYGHIRPFTKTSLTRLLQDCGFDVQNVAHFRNSKSLALLPYLLGKSILLKDSNAIATGLASLVGAAIYAIARKP